MPAVDEVRFEVMTTQATVLVVGGPRGAAAAAERRVRDLERRWTRFGPSEITALAEGAGEPVAVSAETVALVEASITAWECTGGRFDPSIGPALAALGYDRTIGAVVSGSSAPVEHRGPAPGLVGVRVWPDRREVLLPRGVALDPGGIGKGLAADLVVDELLDAGAEGAMVDLGGDCRVAGRSPGPGTEWTLTVEDPWSAGVELARIELAGGGVATSSCLRRRWLRAGRTVHHLVDPRTGEPTETDVVAVTAVAGAAWWAEATTKAVMVGGSEAGLASLHEASALVVRTDGTTCATDDLAGAVLRTARRPLGT